MPCAIKDMSGENNDYEDNRENPPDYSVLIQRGHKDSGEGDTVRLLIRKRPIIGIMEPEAEKENKKKHPLSEANGVGSATNSKKKKYHTGI